MKKIKPAKLGTMLLAILLAFSLANCNVHTHHSHHHHKKTKKIPPGQAKKMSGNKSAKKHAPGHNK